MLRPRPTGARRLVAGYLCVASGTAAAAIIVAAFDRAADSCTVDGFGCLGLVFRGIAMATAVGLAILVSSSILVKLGGLYALAVVGFSLAALTIAVFLGRAGVPALPIGIALLAAVPALAAWTTRPRSDRAVPVARSNRSSRTVESAARSLQPLAR